MLRSAAQSRKAKEDARKKAEPVEPPKLRRLDSVLSLLGNLSQAEQEHAEGKDVAPIHGDLDESAPPKPKRAAGSPKPKRVASKPSSAPKEPPKQPSAKPPIDRTPPAPKQVAKDKAEPSGPPPSSGNLNDLFGGGGDRVRIGKRSMPKAKPSEE